MRKRILWNAFAVLALGGLFAFPLAFAGTQRSDCPGKVVCPLTGEDVCKDQCPLGAKKTDCPGQIECPVADDLKNEVERPACCRAQKT